MFIPSASEILKWVCLVSVTLFVHVLELSTDDLNVPGAF